MISTDERVLDSVCLQMITWKILTSQRPSEVFVHITAELSRGGNFPRLLQGQLTVHTEVSSR